MNLHAMPVRHPDGHGRPRLRGQGLACLGARQRMRIRARVCTIAMRASA